MFNTSTACVGQSSNESDKVSALDIQANLGSTHMSHKTVTVPWDSDAGGILLNTPDPFFKWDDRPLNAVVTSCFGQKIHSKGSGRARLGFVHGGETYYEEVHAVYVPELPQSLIGATAMLNHYNVSTHLCKPSSYIVLSSGKRIPLGTANDMLTCDCMVLERHMNYTPVGKPLPSTFLHRSNALYDDY